MLDTPSTETLYIITGASRGLGEALARRLLHPEHRLLCVARTENAKLRSEAEAAGVRLEWHTCDLAAAPENLEFLMEGLLHRAGVVVSGTEAPVRLPRLRLINNAGVLEPIGPVHEAAAAAIALNVAVNLTAPMTLTAAFLRLTEKLPADKRVLNISSGAGRKPYYGWSSYCATKAGLDHFTRCVKLEQDSLPYGTKLASVAPGVIDTAMQASIRAGDERSFRDLPRFIALHRTGALTPPDEAAERLLRLLEHTSFGDEPVVDVRDFA